LASWLLVRKKPADVFSGLQFVEDFGSEISEMKLSLKTRARAVADDFWRVMEQRQQSQQQQQQLQRLQL
jgi:hypothetical protein